VIDSWSELYPYRKIQSLVGTKHKLVQPSAWWAQSSIRDRSWSQAGLTLATGDTVIKFRSLFSISFFALSPHQKLYRRHYTHRFSATCSLNELHMRSEGSFITFHSFAASLILLRRMLHFFFGKWMFFLFSLKDCYYDGRP